MKHGVFIINTSRGGLIDETALADAIQNGIVDGAALDVFEHEPLPDNSRLRTFDSCIFGSHNSSNTKESVDRVNEFAINNLIEGLIMEEES
jgi:D-3-phosphoglycerate dehydrogenase